jgi:hypothetical protein
MGCKNITMAEETRLFFLSRVFGLYLKVRALK